jgi:methyl-accepting chemotaxis protein
MNILNNVKVGPKLTLAFGCLLALMAVQAVVGAWILRDQTRGTQAMLDVRAARIFTAGDALHESVNLRRFEKDMLINMSSAEKVEHYAAEWEKSLGKVRDAVKSLQDSGASSKSANDEMAQRLASVLTHLDRYAGVVETVHGNIRDGSVKDAAGGNEIIALVKDDVRDAERDIGAIVEGERKAISDERVALAQRSEQAQKVMLAILGVAVLVGFGATWAMRRGIVAPLAQAQGLAARVAAGNFEERKAYTGFVQRGDEFGRLLDSLDRMRASLLEKETAEAVAATEMLRLKSALDASPAAIMLADNAGKVAYCNRAQRELLRVANPDLRAAIPGFDPEAVVGTGLDALLQRGGGRDGEARRSLAYGKRSFLVEISAVQDEAGKPQGVVAAWRDRTAEIAIEKEIEAVTTSAAAGDFSGRVLVEGKSGFDLALARNMNRVLESSDTGLAEVGRVLASFSEGDLSQRVEGRFEGRWASLQSDCTLTADRLGQVVSDLRQAGSAIADAAAQVSSTAQAIAQAASEQSNGVEQVSGAMQGIADAVDRNARSASGTEATATEAARVAAQGAAAVQRMVQDMAQITQRISVIDDIAYQTNLLALNAAIEAARAGDAGKGFAVVAGEVRKLAERSKVAAQEIGSLAQTSSGTAREAGSMISRMVPAIEKTSEHVREIAAASSEQSSDVMRAGDAVQELSGATMRNAAAAEQLAATSEELSGQAEHMRKMMAFFTSGEERSAAESGEEAYA